jgi:hypothetical protein
MSHCGDKRPPPDYTTPEPRRSRLRRLFSAPAIVELTVLLIAIAVAALLLWLADWAEPKYE